MAFLRGSQSSKSVAHKNKEVDEAWREPPMDDEFAIIDGIIMILKTLQDVMQSAPAMDTEELQVNREVIRDALKLIQDLMPKMKTAQTGGKLAAMRELWAFTSSNTDYVAKMHDLALSFEKIHVTVETEARWRDLSKWMKALHAISANALKDAEKDEQGFVKALEDGTYPTIDNGDMIFKTATRGVSKYALIAPIGKAALNVERKHHEHVHKPATTPAKK